MSGIIVVIAVLSWFFGWFLLKIGFGLAGHEQSPWPTRLTLVTLPLSCIVGGPVIYWLTTTSGQAVTPQAANRSLSGFQVPETARDVTFKHRSLDVRDEADFLIAEADFLAWVESMGCPTHVFQRNPDWAMPQAEFVERIPPTVLFGFYFRCCESPECRVEVFGYFDHDASRAFVWRSVVD